MTFPSFVEVTPHDTPHDKVQFNIQIKELVSILEKEMTRPEIQIKLGLFDRKHLRLSYLNPALDSGLIEMTLPDKPQSKLQKYRLTQLGLDYKQKQ